MSDCIFCAIVSGDIPTTKVAETEKSIAFADINPQAPVHLLVVPKSHHVDVPALAAADAEAAADLLALARQVASDAGAEDFRLIFNNGPDAGQTVFHAHGHVLAGGNIALGFEPASSRP